MLIDVKTMELGDVATVQGGFPFRGSVESIATGPVWAVQMKDVAWDEGVNWVQVTRTELPGRETVDWLNDGDILFVNKGTRFYATCIDEPPGRAVCTPHFFRLRVLPEARVLPAFLTWLINQPPVQKQLHQSAEGSNQLSIRRPVLESVVVQIPNFSHQHRFVTLAKLARQERHALQKLILNREQQLEALAESLSPDTEHSE